MIRPIVKSPVLPAAQSVEPTPVENAPSAVLMYNPEIVEASGEYQTEESCLSLEGSRLCTRYRRIKVAYLDASFTPCKKSFSGFDAQIVQHEIDHCNGVVI